MRISDWSSDVCSSDLFMLRMTGETGMQYFFYTAFKEFPHGKRILALPLRTQGERFHPLQHDPGIKGAECRASVAMKRSEEHTSELQSLMRISYAVFCLKKKKNKPINTRPIHTTTNSR